MNQVVTLETLDSPHIVSVIQSTWGEEFDSHHQRTTLGVKWTEVGDEILYCGFWFDTTDMSPLEATAELARQLTLMLKYPDLHDLRDGVTSEEVDVSD